MSEIDSMNGNAQKSLHDVTNFNSKIEPGDAASQYGSMSMQNFSQFNLAPDGPNMNPEAMMKMF